MQRTSMKIVDEISLIINLYVHNICDTRNRDLRSFSQIKAFNNTTLLYHTPGTEGGSTSVGATQYTVQTHLYWSRTSIFIV